MGNVAAEYDGSGNLRARYIHSGASLVSQLDSNGSAAYYDFDGTASTAGLTNAAGSYVNQYNTCRSANTLCTVKRFPTPLRTSVSSA